MTRRMLPIIIASALLAACGSNDDTAPATEQGNPQVDDASAAENLWVDDVTGDDSEVPAEAVHTCDTAEQGDGYWCTTRYQMADNDQRSVVGYVRPDGTVEVVHMAAGESVEEARATVQESTHDTASAPTL